MLKLFIYKKSINFGLFSFTTVSVDIAVCYQNANKALHRPGYYFPHSFISKEVKAN